MIQRILYISSFDNHLPAICEYRYLLFLKYLRMWSNAKLKLNASRAYWPNLPLAFLFLTHWVCASKPPSPRPNPHELNTDANERLEVRRESLNWKSGLRRYIVRFAGERNLSGSETGNRTREGMRNFWSDYNAAEFADFFSARFRNRYKLVRPIPSI